MTEQQPSQGLSARDRAFQLTKHVFVDSARLEALKMGVGDYTENVEGQFRGIEEFTDSETQRFSPEYKGAAWMLWGSVVAQLETGNEVTFDDLSPEKLRIMIYQAYVASGASGT